MSNITTYTNANGIAYYSTTNENGETIYSFTEDFEDIWSQDDQDLHMSTTKRVLWTDPNDGSQHEGTVTSVEPDGYQVQFDDGQEGWCNAHETEVIEPTA